MRMLLWSGVSCSLLMTKTSFAYIVILSHMTYCLQKIMWQHSMMLSCATAGIMHNRTAVGFTYNSSSPCPVPPGPCGCKQAGPGQFMYRCRPWTDNEFPFGSEFAWDSTGQEEIYVWGK